MSNLALLWNVAAWIVYPAAIVVVVRRPVQRWRTGWVGKTVSVLGVLLVVFHLGHFLVPVGAGIGVACHRAPPKVGIVPVADGWPGQRP